MRATIPAALLRNFLGHAPDWYKLLIVGFLLVNPLIWALLGPVTVAWCVLAEFIITLAMALKCYPLQPGGLIVIQAILLGLTDVASVYRELEDGLSLILLLVFMVAGIYFLKNLLLLVFTRLLLDVRRPLLLPLLFCLAAALLSAFLNALTVLAVVITMGAGFYEVYHRLASGMQHGDSSHDLGSDHAVHELHHEDLIAFRGFLRGLLMHAAVGSALGGVATQIGEPQNLLIAQQAGWDFVEFFLRVAPVSLPVLLVGLLTCAVLDRWRLFGYGTPLPENVRAVLEQYDRQETEKRSARDRANLVVQALAAIVLIVAVALQLAEVGLIGLLLIILTTSFMGITDEPRIGKAFEAALPFASLLVVFFALVAQIKDQHLFEYVVQWALNFDGKLQTAVFYLATGALSAISNGVIVATIFIAEIKAALLEGVIGRQQFEALAVAVNVGTTIPSIAMPNGQAPLLFLLSSALAPLIRLSYGRMLWMALPYAVVLTAAGLLAILYRL